MTGYSIVWKFDVDEGHTLENGIGVYTPEDAALAAFEAFTRRNSIAHVFEVTDEEGNETRVDLDEGGLEVTTAIIITGGPLGGFDFTGPSRDEDDPENYADEYSMGGEGDDRWIVALNHPRD